MSKYPFSAISEIRGEWATGIYDVSIQYTNEIGHADSQVDPALPRIDADSILLCGRHVKENIPMFLYQRQCADPTYLEAGELFGFGVRSHTNLLVANCGGKFLEIKLICCCDHHQYRFTVGPQYDQGFVNLIGRHLHRSSGFGGIMDCRVVCQSLKWNFLRLE